MAEYDFKKAKKIISEETDVVRASLGMAQDWTWTAETVFEDGEFIIDLDTVKTIGGISGSYWATPILDVEYSDGKRKEFNCYKEGE